MTAIEKNQPLALLLPKAQPVDEHWPRLARSRESGKYQLSIKDQLPIY
jgi:hypothetical protein